MRNSTECSLDGQGEAGMGAGPLKRINAPGRNDLRGATGVGQFDTPAISRGIAPGFDDAVVVRTHQDEVV